MRGPGAVRAARREPGPASLRFVTRMTWPPRPAGVVVPNPSAPGNTASGPAGGGGAAATVITALSLFPPLSAMTIAAPAAAPVTRPELLTLATAPLVLLQATVAPLITPPPASRTVAASCTVPPTSIVSAAGVTVTEPTTGVGVVVAVASKTPKTRRSPVPAWTARASTRLVPGCGPSVHHSRA